MEPRWSDVRPELLTTHLQEKVKMHVLMVITWLLEGGGSACFFEDDVRVGPPKSRERLPTEAGQADTGTGSAYPKAL